MPVNYKNSRSLLGQDNKSNPLADVPGGKTAVAKLKNRSRGNADERIDIAGLELGKSAFKA